MPPDTSNHIFFGLTSHFDIIDIVFGGFGLYCLKLNQKRVHLISARCPCMDFLTLTNGVVSNWFNCFSSTLHVDNNSSKYTCQSLTVIKKSAFCVTAAFILWKHVYPYVLDIRDHLKDIQWKFFITQVDDNHTCLLPREDNLYVGVAIAKGGVGFLLQSLFLVVCEL